MLNIDKYYLKKKKNVTSKYAHSPCHCFKVNDHIKYIYRQSAVA